MLGDFCLRWEGLVSPGVPLNWHGVEGEDARVKLALLVQP